MTKEQTYFLTAIKDHLHGRKTENGTDIDWAELFRCAQSHQLTAILHNQCRPYLPADIDAKYQAVSLQTIYTYIQRESETEAALALLNAHGIRCFLIKGIAIARYYPICQYRTMGDTDIVVDDLEKAHSVLIENGFQNISKYIGREYQYMKADMEFEFHDRLVYDEAVNKNKITAFLNDFQGFVTDRGLDESFHFVFALNHLRKHFMGSGIGFRQFVDIAVLVKNDPALNWPWIEEQLQAIGLLPFAKTVFYYIDRWFDVKAPIPSEPVSEAVFLTSTDYIFRNGIWGNDNHENKGHLTSNIVRSAKHPKLAMAKLAVGKVFPGYQSLTVSDTYSFLRGRPLLLPMAWLYRFGRVLKGKRMKEGKTLIRKSFVSDEYIATREQLYLNWRV